jgi:hypothetical protein
MQMMRPNFDRIFLLMRLMLHKLMPLLFHEGRAAYNLSSAWIHLVEFFSVAIPEAGIMVAIFGISP